MQPFNKGVYDYQECFFAETRGYLEPSANEEKHQIAVVVAEFAKFLAERDYVFGKKEPLRWLEPGFGDGFATENYLKALAPHQPGGFSIHGSDIEDRSLKNASTRLSALQGMFAEVAEIRKQDAFAPADLTDTPCDFALGSHMVYWARHLPDGSRPTQQQIMDRVEVFMGNMLRGLQPDGLMLLFHEARDSELSGSMGGTFGYPMKNASENVETAAYGLGLPLAQLSLHPRLFFPKLDDKTLKGFESLDNWRDIDPQSDEASWLKKFLFSMQNKEKREDGKIIYPGGALGLAQDGRLQGAVHRLRDMLEHNGGFITMHAKMQAVPKDPGRRPLLQEAFEHIYKELPRLNLEVDRLRAAAKPALAYLPGAGAEPGAPTAGP